MNQWLYVMMILDVKEEFGDFFHFALYEWFNIDKPRSEFKMRVC